MQQQQQQKQNDENMIFLLPENYQPTKYDVICGRGRGLYNNPGNKRLRYIASCYVTEYINSSSKLSKSVILENIMKQVCGGEPMNHNNHNINISEKKCEAGGGSFIKYDNKRKRWYKIDLDHTQYKIGHAMREIVSSYYKNKLLMNSNNENNNEVSSYYEKVRTILKEAEDDDKNNNNIQNKNKNRTTKQNNDTIENNNIPIIDSCNDKNRKLPLYITRNLSNSTSSTNHHNTNCNEDDDNFRLQFSLRYLEQQGETQSEEDTPFFLPEDFKPSNNDIVFGRGRGYYNYPGNKRYRSIIRSYTPLYTTLKCKAMRTSLIKKMTDQITKEVCDKPSSLSDDDDNNNNNFNYTVRRRGHFIKYDQTMKRWQQMSRNNVHAKIGHAIRSTVAATVTKTTTTCGSSKNVHRKKAVNIASSSSSCDDDDDDDDPTSNNKQNGNEQHHKTNKKIVTVTKTATTCGSSKNVHRKKAVNIASSSSSSSSCDDDDDDDDPTSNNKQNGNEHHHKTNKKIVITSSNDEDKQLVHTKVITEPSLLLLLSSSSSSSYDDNQTFEKNKVSNKKKLLQRQLKVSNNNKKQKVKVSSLVVDDNIKYIDQACNKIAHKRVIPSSFLALQSHKKINIQQKSEKIEHSTLLSFVESSEKKTPKLISASFHQRMNIDNRILNNKTSTPVMNESAVVREEVVTACEGEPAEMALSLSSSSYERERSSYHEACENTENTITTNDDEKFHKVDKKEKNQVCKESLCDINVVKACYETLQKENALLLSSYESMVLDDDKTIENVDYDNMKEEAAASDCKSTIHNKALSSSSSISDKEIIEPIIDELCEATEPFIIKEDFVRRKKIQNGIATSSSSSSSEATKQTGPNMSKNSVIRKKNIPVLQQKQKRSKHKNKQFNSLILLKKVQQKLFHDLLAKEEQDDNYIIYSNMNKKRQHFGKQYQI